MCRAAPSLVLTALLAAGCLRPPAPATVAPSTGGAAAGDAGHPAAAAAPAVSAQPTRAEQGKRDSVRPSPAAARPGVSGDSVSAADVTRETARMFGAETPPPPTDSMVAPGAPVWDIDVRSYETRKRVADYVQIFSSRARDIFQVALQRQTRYGPMVRERLKRIGLPEDLSYLALVESWFDPHAYSRAAAVGMWQFMAGTARGMGLRVDWWVDERRDPVRSTEAAARLLLGLRQEFGSLYLAAAAYNGGSGRVSRGLARYADALDGIDGEDRFFALAEKSYLRPETRNYVPKIIAAALVGGEPARYGVHVESLPPYSYDSVRAPGATPLAAVANALGVSASDVSELNPHVLRGMTPPSDSLWVRVPAGRAVNFAERFSALEPDERRALTRIESKKGQTMLSLAKKYDLTQKQLGWYNPKVAKLKSGALRSGQTILVPRRDVAALARDVPNPSVERYPRRGSVVRRHRVVAGETLSGIAKKYGVSVKTLVRLNGLNSATVIPGQSLVVSGRATSGSTKPTAKSATKASSAKKPTSGAKKLTSGAKAKASSAGAGTSGAKKKPGAR